MRGIDLQALLSRASLVRVAWYVSILCSLAFISLAVSRGLIPSLTIPPWDFRVFWLTGNAAKAGLNPYSSSDIRYIAALWDQQNFTIADPDLHYPPPALLLFAILATIPLRIALVLWLVITVAIVIISALLPFRWFPVDSKRSGLFAPPPCVSHHLQPSTGLHTSIL